MTEQQEQNLSHLAKRSGARRFPDTKFHVSTSEALESLSCDPDTFQGHAYRVQPQKALEFAL